MNRNFVVRIICFHYYFQVDAFTLTNINMMNTILYIDKYRCEEELWKPNLKKMQKCLKR